MTDNCCLNIIFMTMVAPFNNGETFNKNNIQINNLNFCGCFF